MEKTCKCGWIDEMVNDPEVPIKYLEITKKYAFQYSPRKNVYNSIYIDYCPSCGGKVSAPGTRGKVQ